MKFHYLMDLHYSQTLDPPCKTQGRFTTLWIYTILKRVPTMFASVYCFTTLWIYTILKPFPLNSVMDLRFTTLWIYTILKLVVISLSHCKSFTTLWIYTILKRFRIFKNSPARFTTLWIYTILKPQISCAHYTAQGKSTRSSTIVLWRNEIVKGAQIPIQHIEFGAHIYAHRRLAL